MGPAGRPPRERSGGSPRQGRGGRVRKSERAVRRGPRSREDVGSRLNRASRRGRRGAAWRRLSGSAEGGGGGEGWSGGEGWGGGGDGRCFSLCDRGEKPSPVYKWEGRGEWRRRGQPGVPGRGCPSGPAGVRQDPQTGNGPRDRRGLPEHPQQ